ncbi:hypothetical protein [Croceicoccus naphthovorans]|uniref:Uncharacterized protein n=1 Tax=Croceicoccus naphthovorans TaxID=1348774 RepID=A0A0G3XCM9_9SPHN|nr:hypothetical protein [Croceicoccus naphthovorans]AKM09310.1 hypothetical protein AB433_03865 [Croceicoccus naphthovorans]MBB3990216.1 hypothetical protein [Croceicoccus naphthovorans]
MAEVPDHLVPSDGFTNSTVRYAGFDAIPGESGASHRFEFVDGDGRVIGTYRIETKPTSDGTIDAMVAGAHRQMTNVLRQWLFVTDKVRAHYEK